MHLLVLLLSSAAGGDNNYRPLHLIPGYNGPMPSVDGPMPAATARAGKPRVGFSALGADSSEARNETSSNVTGANGTARLPPNSTSGYKHRHPNSTPGVDSASRRQMQVTVKEPGVAATGGGTVENVGGSTYANYMVLDTDEDEDAVVATTKGIPVTASIVVLTTAGGATISVVRSPYSVCLSLRRTLFAGARSGLCAEQWRWCRNGLHSRLHHWLRWNARQRPTGHTCQQGTGNRSHRHMPMAAAAASSRLVWSAFNLTAVAC